MKLYYAPGACSLGIHFLLEESGAPYEAVPVHLKQGEHLTAAYAGINPKAKVPVLQRADGSILTEFGAIAQWLAQTCGAGAFGCDTLEERIRATETLDFVVGTIHMQGFSRILRPQKFTPDAAGLDWVRQQGLDIVTRGFALLAGKLGDAPFINGARLSMADAALFYTLFWAIERVSLDLPGNLTACYARLKNRPAALAVFRAEGLS